MPYENTMLNPASRNPMMPMDTTFLRVYHYLNLLLLIKRIKIVNIAHKSPQAQFCRLVITKHTIIYFLILETNISPRQPYRKKNSRETNNINL